MDSGGLGDSVEHDIDVIDLSQTVSMTQNVMMGSKTQSENTLNFLRNKSTHANRSTGSSLNNSQNLAKIDIAVTQLDKSASQIE